MSYDYLKMAPYMVDILLNFRNVHVFEFYFSYNNDVSVTTQHTGRYLEWAYPFKDNDVGLSSTYIALMYLFTGGPKEQIEE